jgi:ATP-dependent DNA helicase RecG
MLFKDRLEVWNPGTLPPTLTLEKLRGPHASVPHNPLLAEPMYLTKYIERMGTGIRDMIRRCRAAGLAEPEIRLDGGFFVLTIRRKKSELGAQSAPSRDQVTGQVTGQVAGQVDPWFIRALTACAVKPLSSREIQESTGLRHRETFQRNYLDQIINDGLVERTIPEKPTSRLQKYRLTEKGRKLLEQLGEKGGHS